MRKHYPNFDPNEEYFDEYLFTKTVSNSRPSDFTPKQILVLSRLRNIENYFDVLNYRPKYAVLLNGLITIDKEYKTDDDVTLVYDETTESIIVS